MNIEKIVKILPLGGVTLIGLGVIKVSVYYNYFGVDIMSYLSTIDVLTLFLNDLQIIMALLTTAIMHLILSDRFIELVENKIGEDFLTRFVRTKKNGYVIFYSIFLSCLIGIMFFQFFLLKNWLIYLWVFISTQLICFLFIRKNGDHLIKNVSYLNFFLGLCVLSIVPLIALKEIREIERNEGTKVQLTITNNRQIKSSNFNRFLGKAGENFFFYNPVKKSTTIYKFDNIQEIKIKN
jgi:hypothetical protein